MTTTTAQIEIVCPGWCNMTAEEHVANLWNTGGECHHMTPEHRVEDPAGFRDTLGDDRAFAEAVSIDIVARTRPDGRECGSPTFYLNGHELTIEQAEVLAVQIRALTDAYRVSFGSRIAS